MILLGLLAMARTATHVSPPDERYGTDWKGSPGGSSWEESVFRQVPIRTPNKDVGRSFNLHPQAPQRIQSPKRLPAPRTISWVGTANMGRFDFGRHRVVMIAS